MAPPEDLITSKQIKLGGVLEKEQVISYMLENPIVSNSTCKSKNLLGADNQQETF